MNPIVLKLLPWVLILVMAAGLYGGYKYVKVLQDNARQAVNRAEALAAEKAAMVAEVKKNEALLAEREVGLIAANKRIAAQHRKLEELKHEGCLDLDAPAPWLNDILLPGGVPVQPAGG